MIMAILIAIIWVLLGIVLSYKQSKAGNEATAILALVFSPIWFIGAIIRQVFIEDWK